MDEARKQKMLGMPVPFSENNSIEVITECIFILAGLVCIAHPSLGRPLAALKASL